MHWSYRWAKKRLIRGIRVGVLWSSEDLRERIFEKVATAIDILHAHDPRSLDRLRVHANGVLVFGRIGTHLGSWYSGPRLVVLREGYVDDPSTSPTDVASTLVHESTHAWLDSLGFPYDAELRARIEAICVRSQLVFARRLPDPSDLIDQAERKLGSDPAYWTDEAFHARAKSALLEIGVPKWFVKVLEWLRQRRTTLQSRRRRPSR